MVAGSVAMTCMNVEVLLLFVVTHLAVEMM